MLKFIGKMNELDKRMEDDFFEMMNRSIDSTNKIRKRQRDRFENQRHSYPNSYHESSQNPDCHSTYVIDANGFKTKLKQVS